ncbi:MAG: hypothetical protein ACRDMX_06260 [Solirubrobacteraceae bacterium]
MDALLEAQITIRPGYGDDLEQLTRLAELDSAAAPPPAPLLLAELDGELAAAISLADGTVIADPFRPTERLVALLRAHAAPAAPKQRLASRRVHAARRRASASSAA